MLSPPVSAGGAGYEASGVVSRQACEVASARRNRRMARIRTVRWCPSDGAWHVLLPLLYSPLSLKRARALRKCGMPPRAMPSVAPWLSATH